MTGNPIVRRELIGLLRRPRSLAVQVGLVAVLGALVLFRWPAEGFVALSGAQAQEVLRVLGYGLLVAMILVSPAFPATSFVREWQKGTLILLLTSPMGRWRVLSGKVLGALGFVWLLLVLSLPAAAACYSMGGVGIAQTGKMYLVLIAVTVQYASLALWVSTRARSTDGALRATYGLVLVLAVLSLGPHQFLQGLFGGPLGRAIDWSRCLSPVPAMLEVLGQVGVAERGMMGGGSLAGRYMLLAALTTAGFLLATAMRLSPTMFDRSRTTGPVTEKQPVGVRIYRRLMYLYDPQRRRKLIPLWVNPVLVKEFRTRRFGRFHWIARLFAVCLILSLGLILVTTRVTVDWGVGTIAGVVVLLQMALLLLLTPSLASGVISGELETGNWQLLQMTPISPARILTGKVVSVLWTLLLVLLATLPACAVLLLIEPKPAMRVNLANALLTLLVTAVYGVLLSAAVSSLFRRTATATAVAYGILAAQCAATLLFWMGGDGGEAGGAGPWFGHETVAAVLSVNPVAAALAAMETPGFEGLALIPQTWWILGAAAGAALGILIARTWALTRPQ